MIDKDTVKNRLSCIEYMAHYGHQPTSKSGEWMQYKCPPYRPDGDSGGFKASADGWVDFVSDQKGDVISLAMQHHGCEFYEAVEICADLAGMPKEEQRQATKTANKPQRSTINPQNRAEVCSYPYKDQTGATVYEVVRFEPKDFRQRRHVQGKTVWNLQGVTKILYRLPEVMKADIVWLVEGEKDADNLTELGFCATTNCGGASNWVDDYAVQLAGKTVVYCGDSDDAGAKHKAKVLSSLEGTAKAVHVVSLPDGYKDVSDYIEAFDGDKAQDALTALAQNAEVLPRGYRITSEDAMTAASKIMRYWREGAGTKEIFVWGDWLSSFSRLEPLRPGDLVVVMGYTGSCKTLVKQHLSMSCVHNVSWFQMELPRSRFWERIYAMQSGLSQHQVQEVFKGHASHKLNAPTNIRADYRSGLTVDQICEGVKRDAMAFGATPSMVIVDYLQLCRGKGGSKYEQMSGIAEDLKIAAKNLECVIVLGSQVKRPEQGKSRKIGLWDAKDSGSIENSASHLLGINIDSKNERTIEVLKCSTGGEGTEARISIDWSNMTITEETTEIHRREIETDITEEWFNK